MIDTVVESNFGWEINGLFWSETVTNSKHFVLIHVLLTRIKKVLNKKKILLSQNILLVFSSFIKILHFILY